MCGIDEIANSFFFLKQGDYYKSLAVRGVVVFSGILSKNKEQIYGSIYEQVTWSRHQLFIY